MVSKSIIMVANESEVQQAREQLKAAIRTYSFRENQQDWFTLASGRKSPYYFDLKQTLLQPQYLRLAALLLLQEIKRFCPVAKAVGGLTMGADPLTYAITLADRDSGGALLPLIVRKQVKDHGSKKPVEGLLSQLNNGDEAVLLEDVVTTGMSALIALEALRQQGLVVKHCFAILDRDEGGAAALAERGVTLHTLFQLEDFRSPA